MPILLHSYPRDSNFQEIKTIENKNGGLKAKISFQNKTQAHSLSLSLSLSVSHCACACVSVRKMETQAAEEPVRTKMESLRLTCEREIQIHQQKIESYASSFRNSLQSIKSRAQQTAQNQGLLHDDVLFFCFFFVSVFPPHFCKIRVLIFLGLRLCELRSN